MNEKDIIFMYHEAICKDLDAGVSERGGGKLEGTEVAGKDLGGHGHEVVDHVNDNSRSSEVEKELELDPCSVTETQQEGQGSVGQYALKLTT
jgi:hypothetical protein